MCQWCVFLISPALNSANACSLFSFLISLKQKKTGTVFLWYCLQSERLLLLLLKLMAVVTSQDGVVGASLHSGLIPALCMVMQDNDLGMGA